MPIYNNNDYIRIMRPLPQYVSRDIYGIPVIEPVPIDISNMNNGLWLINMKSVSKDDTLSKRKIVHSFCYDDVLQSAYNNPITFLSRVSSYYAVTSFDFSMDNNMDFKQILEATYNNRWSGAFMQANGKLVIPTVGWLKPDTYDITFAGLRDGGTFMISTLGVNNKDCIKDFLNGYSEMRNRYPATKIISVGDRIAGMDDDVCYVKYADSFGAPGRYQPFWQPSFINWDMSIPKGV